METNELQETISTFLQSKSLTSSDHHECEVRIGHVDVSDNFIPDLTQRDYLTLLMYLQSQTWKRIDATEFTEKRTGRIRTRIYDDSRRERYVKKSKRQKDISLPQYNCSARVAISSEVPTKETDTTSGFRQTMTKQRTSFVHDLYTVDATISTVGKKVTYQVEVEFTSEGVHQHKTATDVVTAQVHALCAQFV